MPGDPSYTCVEITMACLSDHTCECLDVGPEGECELGGDGGLTVQIFGA